MRPQTGVGGGLCVMCMIVSTVSININSSMYYTSTYVLGIIYRRWYVQNVDDCRRAQMWLIL